MESKKNLIVGVIAALAVVGTLLGLKMYNDGKVPVATDQTQAQQQQTQPGPVNNNDPYANYSAPTQQNNQ